MVGKEMLQHRMSTRPEAPGDLAYEGRLGFGNSTLLDWGRVTCAHKQGAGASHLSEIKARGKPRRMSLEQRG